MTDDEWQYIAAKNDHLKKAAKNMPDDIEDDHLVDTTQIQFVNDAQWQFISHDMLVQQAEDFVSDDEYRFNMARKMEQKFNDKNMPDWIEDDHLVQTAQGWVELPDCASAADASRPLAGTAEDGLNSAATCKPGTHWAPAPATPPVVPEPKPTGLGATRPY